MAKTPVKPPSDKIEKIAAKALPKGKASKPATKTMAGRLLSERSATKKGK